MREMRVFRGAMAERLLVDGLWDAGAVITALANL